jgi:hypothetical protein
MSDKSNSCDMNQQHLLVGGGNCSVFLLIYLYSNLLSVTLDPCTQVAKIKAEATSLFSNGMYGEAVSRYTQCVEGLDKDNPGHWYHISLLLSNRAACKLKVNNIKAIR